MFEKENNITENIQFQVKEVNASLEVTYYTYEE